MDGRRDLALLLHADGYVMLCQQHQGREGRVHSVPTPYFPGSTKENESCGFVPGIFVAAVFFFRINCKCPKAVWNNSHTKMFFYKGKANVLCVS